MSDSISRQKVLATLDFADNALDEDRTVENYKELLTECIKALTSNFDRMTNGEVIQAIYGVMVLNIKDGKVWAEKIYFPFDLEWWNAPYSAKSEE